MKNIKPKHGSSEYKIVYNCVSHMSRQLAQHWIMWGLVRAINTRIGWSLKGGKKNKGKLRLEEQIGVNFQTYMEASPAQIHSCSAPCCKQKPIHKDWWFPRLPRRWLCGALTLSTCCYAQILFLSSLQLFPCLALSTLPQGGSTAPPHADHLGVGPDLPWW